MRFQLKKTDQEKTIDKSSKGVRFCGVLLVRRNDGIARFIYLQMGLHVGASVGDTGVYVGGGIGAFVGLFVGDAVGEYTGFSVGA